jgi:hypothetical protein
MKKVYTVQSEIWLYQGTAGWYFVTLPKKESSEIKELYKNKSKSWGSVPVVVTLGTTTWTTSIFPDKRSGCYLLPIKSEVRKKEDVTSGDKVTFKIKIVQ